MRVDRAISVMLARYNLTEHGAILAGQSQNEQKGGPLAKLVGLQFVAEGSDRMRRSREPYWRKTTVLEPLENVAKAKLRAALHANSNDRYRLRRARVRRLFFRFRARRNLYRSGCGEDRGAPKREGPDLRAWLGRARCKQCRSRPAFVCDRIRAGCSCGGCSISCRRHAVPARRRLCRPLLRL